MFTNNYIAFQHNRFFNVSGPGAGYSIGDVTVHGQNLTSVRGTTISSSLDKSVAADLGRCLKGKCMPLLTADASSASAANGGLYFGSGTTPATKEDITLESLIASGLTIANGNIFFENDANGRHVISVDNVLTNTTDAPITISEIGLISGVANSSSKYTQVLFERTVLSSPITIAPGESKLITYKITFNQSQ
jgi:hypothetical protein